MFCPFINGPCREDCTFRHVPRATAGAMINNPSKCILAISADALDQWILFRTQQEES